MTIFVQLPFKSTEAHIQRKQEYFQASSNTYCKRLMSILDNINIKKNGRFNIVNIQQKRPVHYRDVIAGS